jgi:response regulator of citrate/malate metabolism
MESIDSKIERMCKTPVVDISHNLKAKKAAAVKKQKEDTAKALKAAMAFNFSKVKKKKKPFVAGMTSTKKAALLKKVIDFHEAGTPVNNIAEKLKINKQTARMYLLRSGHKPIRSVRITKGIQDKVNIVIKYHKQGIPLCDIVQKVKIDKRTVKRYLIKAGHKPILKKRSPKKKGAKCEK